MLHLSLLLCLPLVLMTVETCTHAVITHIVIDPIDLFINRGLVVDGSGAGQDVWRYLRRGHLALNLHRLDLL